MTIRYPKSFAGIIEAIKTRSGSNKFYKPNYEGVIQAILEWTGGGSIEIIYPPAEFPDTGNDGDLVAYPDAEGDWFIWIWADEGWQPMHVLTTNVKPNPPFQGVVPEMAPTSRKTITTPDGQELSDQRDINWYLYNLINNRVCKDEDLESTGDTLPITEDQYAVVYDPVKDTSSVYLHPDKWNEVFDEDSEKIWIDGKAYEIVDVVTAPGAMIAVVVEGEVETTAGETVNINSCNPGGNGECPMVFYGPHPPDEAKTGALFTQEDSLKQFVHQEDGSWIDLSNCGGSGAKQMVFYGTLPPDEAPEGALFTHEDSLKQFTHQGEGLWIENTCSCGNDKS